MKKSDARKLIAPYLLLQGGFTTRDVLGRFEAVSTRRERQIIFAACHDMAHRDASPTLWVSKTGHRTSRYFGRREWAEAHQAATPYRTYDGNKRETTAYCGEWRAPRKGMTYQLRGRAWWAPDAAPIETPTTKYTFAPPPPARVLRSNTHAIF